MTNLLTINGNPKVIKGDKLNTEWQSAIMHLHPSSTRICPYQDIAKCKGFSKIFGEIPNFTKNHVNMRTTWSGQSQVEFSQTTIGEDIAQRNSR